MRLTKSPLPVKAIILKALFFLATCSLFTLQACAPHGPHKPVNLGGRGKPTPVDQPGSPQTGASLSYTDVQPIFGARCARCHNAGAINWMDETTATAAAQAGKMRVMIEGRIMPMDGTPEAAAITDEEREKILEWADSASAGPQVASPPAAPAPQ